MSRWRPLTQPRRWGITARDIERKATARRRTRREVERAQAIVYAVNAEQADRVGLSDLARRMRAAAAGALNKAEALE